MYDNLAPNDLRVLIWLPMRPSVNLGSVTPQPLGRTPQRSALCPGGETLLAGDNPRTLGASRSQRATILRASGTTSREGGR